MAIKTNGTVSDEKLYAFTNVIAMALLLLTLYIYHEKDHFSFYLVAFAAGVTTSAVVAPSLVRPLAACWFKIAILLSRVVNPCVMAILFYVVLTPFGLIARLAKSDLLALRQPKGASYWISRQDHPGTDMTKQF